MKGPIALAAVMAMLSISTALSASAAPGHPPVAPGLARATDEGMVVSTAWLSSNLQDGRLVVLHVGRNRAEYDEGHIPGARFLPLSEIVTEIDGIPNELPTVAHLDSVFQSLGVMNDSRIIIYGEPLLAARTFFTLDYLGAGDRTAILDGGLVVWRAEGRATATEPTRFRPGTFTSRVQPQRVVDARWVLDHLDDRGIALIDARPPIEYSGEQPGAGIPRGGHIPGAANLFWMTLVESNERPVLKDRETLRALFAAAGASADHHVVTYCRSGVQASFAYFVSRLLGYESSMYDGSFLDWSPRAELPVAR